MRTLSWKKKLAFSLVACLLFFVLIEAGLHLRRYLRRTPPEKTAAVRNQYWYFVPHPFLNYTLNPDHPNHNSMGFRGKEFAVAKKKGVCRIVCMGGSTTYDTRVSEDETYASVLQKVLNESGTQTVEVINAGVPGYTSANLLIQLHFKILPMSPDMVIVCTGFNDVYARLAGVSSFDYSGFNTVWTPLPLGKKILFTSILAQRFIGPLGYKWNVRYLKWPPHLHEITRTPAADRAEDPRVDLTKEFEGTSSTVFERNITSLIQLAKANGVRVVLLTEPLLASTADGLNPLFEKALAQHCAAMRQVAEREKVLLVNLDKTFPRKPDYYADCIHMTKEGNSKRARLIARSILGPTGK
jgi:lysophospholipase L1-like esterase